MAGLGVLLAVAPGAPAPTTAEVQLASTESMFPLAPLDCSSTLGAAVMWSGSMRPRPQR